MSEYEIDVVLTGVAADLADSRRELDALADVSGATSDALDNIEARLDAVLAGHATSQAGPASEALGWDQVVQRCEQTFLSRGAALDGITLADIVDPAEVARVQRRFEADFDVRARLDHYDVMVAIAAGVTATLVDSIITATPATSPITTWLRKQSVPENNWLSGLAKVPFDKVVGIGIDGMSPRTHRVQTFGHDPLLGLVAGAVDILRGTLTGFDPSGQLSIVQIGRPPTTNWPAAIAREIAHLLSDLPTHCGLPLPGWTALGLMRSADTGVGSAALARSMYVNGYDTWHFMALSAPNATIELTCRGYWAVRQMSDAEFADATSGYSTVGDSPRYQALVAVATAAAAAGDLATFVALGRNPLHLNYLTWVKLARSGVTAIGRRMASPSSRLADRMLDDMALLETGWAAPS